MIFSLESKKEKFLENIYKTSIKELEKFFEIKLKKTPFIYLVKDRNTINQLLEKKTPIWMIGWNDSKNIYILDKKYYEKESCHKYSPKAYSYLIKHELSHVFTQTYSNIFEKSIKPDWLWEGLALYLSGQNRTKNKPKQFKNFLKYYSQNIKNPGVYKESGFVVGLLINKYGKNKLLKLIKSLKKINSNKKFDKKFEEIYGFKLEYKNFNS